MFRLATVWTHLHQSQLPFLDEAVRKLGLLTNLGDNWAYAFLQLNEGAQHVPLCKEGHISTMVDTPPQKSACDHLCQLEVCHLLQCGDQVVYPKGLNGGLEPVQTSLSRTFAQCMDTLGKTAYEPSFLLVDLPHASPGDLMAGSPAPHGTSTPTSPHHAVEGLSKTNSHLSMTTEVQELLSQAFLDTSNQASGDFMPRRPTTTTAGAPLSGREGDLPGPATTPQASLWTATPSDTVPLKQVPKVTSAPLPN